MFKIFEPVQMLIIVGMSENKFTHVNINRSPGILIAQITQGSDNNVNKDIQIIGIEKLMARFMFEYVQDDFLGGMNTFRTPFNV